MRENNRDVFLKLYSDIMENEDIEIRGSNVKECINKSFSIDPLYPITSFKSRKLNLQYAKKEVLWYIRGDRFDLSICDIAGAWNDVVQKDGGINSNYGQTIFTGPSHYDWVVEELVRDKNSRRAIIVLGESDKLNLFNTDHRCTMYICYQIRNNILTQSVYMRSNDAVFGITNDVFFFGLLHQFVWSDLVTIYKDLKIGLYYHHANSLHIYDRHYDMVRNIINNDDWYVTHIPIIGPGGNDLKCLRKCTTNDSEFYRWIKE